MIVVAEVAVKERLNESLLEAGKVLLGTMEAAADASERVGGREETGAGVALSRVADEGVFSFLILLRFEARSSFGEPQKAEGAL